MLINALDKLYICFEYNTSAYIGEACKNAYRVRIDGRYIVCNPSDLICDVEYSTIEQ